MKYKTDSPGLGWPPAKNPKPKGDDEININKRNKIKREYPLWDTLLISNIYIIRGGHFYENKGEFQT